MTARLEPGPPGIIVRIAMPSLAAGMLSHARKAAPACSHRSFTVVEPMIALDYSTARSVFHHRLRLRLSRNERGIHPRGLGTQLESP
jgi:hypothetical protein